jgi:galactonate dehydratase
MKITAVRQFLVDEPTGPALFVKIETTNPDISGYGEATVHFFPRAVAGMVEEVAQYLIGEDPRRIEYLWQAGFRRLFMRGGPVTGAALAGIDMALWDILGKLLNAPVYQLLGGLARKKVRVYGHVAGTEEEIVEKAKRLKERGITAIRCRASAVDDSSGIHDHAKAVDRAVAYTKLLREELGDDVDILIECHGRFDPEWAIKLALRTEKYNPFWIEDPIRPENPASLAQLQAKTSIPIAAGERGHSRWEFREMIEQELINYARPDLCHCGGISEARKIAALAEVHYINLAPHNNQGPIGTAAGLHLSLAVPNVAILEAPWVNEESPETGVCWPYPVLKDGYALPLEGPGLGIEFDEDAARKGTFKPRMLPKLSDPDGSVRDW